MDIKLNMHEAKTHLSKHLARLGKGQKIILCRRNVPVAEVQLLPKPRKKKRPIGLHKGRFVVPPEFFEPLPDDILEAFEGKYSS